MNHVLKLPHTQLESLRALVDHTRAGIPPPAIAELRSILRKAETDHEDGDPAHVGLGCRVLLVSPHDSGDTFEFEPVLPADENVDEDRLSVARPMCLAVLGKPAGALVEWPLAVGSRRMLVKEVRKPAPLPVA